MTLPATVAVDVGGTKIRAGSVIGGVLAHVRSVPTPATAGAQAVLNTIAEVTGRDIVPEMGERRAGDPPALVADVTRISALLSWKAEFGLEEIVRSAVEAAGMLPNQER